MRTTLQLLRVAIGQPKVEPVSRRREGNFDLYEVEMPVPEFRGFPPKWTFAVFDGAAAGPRRGDDSQLAKARQLVDSLRSRPLTVVVSEDPEFRPGREFELTAPPNVFFVDDDLLERKEVLCSPQLAPFVQAVRRRMPMTAVALPNSPYQCEGSVTGWRFFGRARELKEVTDRRDNMVVVGARRVGKSSLLKEAERIINSRPNEAAHFVDLQNLTNQGQVIDAIIEKVSLKSMQRLVDESEFRHTNVLSVLLERLARGNRRTTLLLDEIGNVLENLEPDRWTILGTFRKYASDSNLRIIMSCFQEELAEKIEELKSPLINFVKIMRVGVFSEPDMREMVLSPLEFWSSPDHHTKESLINLVLGSIGTHPYLLQYFCQALFDPATDQPRDRQLPLIDRARQILDTKESLFNSFTSAVDLIFYRLKWLTLKYLFLKRCWEAIEPRGEGLRQAVIDDDWVESRLKEVGLLSNDTSRWRLLQSMEMHGLTVAMQFDRRRQAIASPLIFLYMRRIEGDSSIRKRLTKLAQEIRGESKEWGLSQA
jgi:hypothetical protein